MANKCCLCNKETLFYIWTSSRDFPRDKFIDLINFGDVDENTRKSQKIFYKRVGKPVCYDCCKKKLGMKL